MKDNRNTIEALESSKSKLEDQLKESRARAVNVTQKYDEQIVLVSCERCFIIVLLPYTMLS